MGPRLPVQRLLVCTAPTAAKPVMDVERLGLRVAMIIADIVMYDWLALCGNP